MGPGPDCRDRRSGLDWETNGRVRPAMGLGFPLPGRRRGIYRTWICHTWICHTWISHTWIFHTWISHTWIAHTWIAHTWITHTWKTAHN